MAPLVDDHEFEWHVALPKLSFVEASVSHLKLTVPLFLLLVGTGYWIANRSIYMSFMSLFAFFLGLSILIILAVNWGWFYIGEKVPPTLVNYMISSQGISIDGKVWPLEALLNVETLFGEKELPEAEWHKPRPSDGQILEIRMSSNQGVFVLRFHEEYVLQKFLRTLKAYLSIK